MRVDSSRRTYLIQTPKVLLLLLLLLLLHVSVIVNANCPVLRGYSVKADAPLSNTPVSTSSVAETGSPDMASILVSAHECSHVSSAEFRVIVLMR